MGMDSSDFSLVQGIRTVNQKMLEELSEIRRQQKQALENDAELAKAFTRVAQALEGLREEMRGLREDITPPLDKPKLKTPAGKLG